MKDEEIIVQQQQDEMSLPENAARELKPGEKYVPILKPDKTYPEITPYSVSLGLIMAVIFSAAAAYLGLKVGQVFDATISGVCKWGLFAGLNDTTMHAREIVKLVRGLDCRVNLIRFHEIPGVDLPGADEKRMEALRDYLTAHGVFTTIRASRGQDIFAACGLLSTAKKQQENG